MGIAKEIFGLERIDRVYEDVNQYNFGVDDGINKTIDKIDAFEISEEAILDIISKSAHEWREDHSNRYSFSISRLIAKAIKANANKIFVRRGK